MGGFTPPLENDPRVRVVKIDTLSESASEVSRTRSRAKIDSLKASLQQHGMLVPPVVTVKDRKVVLLEGSRRVAAAAAIGLDLIEAFWVGAADEFAEWLVADRVIQEADPSLVALPFTWTELGTAYDRALKLLPRGNFTTAYCWSKDVNRGDVQGAALLVRAMRDHADERVRNYARNLLAESEAGVRKPHAAVRYVREFEAAPGGPEAKLSATEQAKIITNLQGQVAGLITGLELLLPLHPDLAEEARKAGGQSLADLGRAVTRVGRALRGGQEAGS